MREIEKYECLETLGSQLRDARLKKELLQAQVAKKIGITQAHYSQIENGKRDLEFATLVKLCVLLEIDLNQVVAECV